jgi:hypothetical protein
LKAAHQPDHAGSIADLTELARSYYDAFMRNDKAFVAARTTDRCWPKGDEPTHLDLKQVAQAGDTVLIGYEGGVGEARFVNAVAQPSAGPRHAPGPSPGEAGRLPTIMARGPEKTR